MAVLPSADGLIVILEGDVMPSLRQCAKNRSMAMLEAELPEQVFEAIVRLRPRVVIVQIGDALDRTLKLIRLVGAAARPVQLIAAATQHSAGIERAVRSAGSTYYLPSTETGPLDRMLDAALVTDQRR